MNDVNPFEMKDIDMAWCGGCGNFGIRNALKDALSELNLQPKDIVIASGIGQGAKMPHYLKCNFFNGLHGRALPAATAIKASNPGIVVICEGGDGDMYGEGGNHFIHTIRRNPDITNLVHNNMVYGLTKGQASPTSRKGFITPVQVSGVTNEPFNPISVAIALDASFVARAYSGDIPRTKEIIKKAVLHKGYALVDILHPCVSFNKINTFQWYKDHTYYLEDSHDPRNRMEAFRRSIEEEKLPLGIFYLNENKTTFENNLKVYDKDKTPLFKRVLDIEKIRKVLASKT